MVYMRKSCLSPCNKAGEIPFVPAIPACLKISADFDPLPRGWRYRLTPTFCQPLSLSYFGCPCVPSYFVLRVRISSLILELDTSCFFEQSNKWTNDWSETIRMKWCIDEKRIWWCQISQRRKRHKRFVIWSVQLKQPCFPWLRSKSFSWCAPSGFCVRLPKPAPKELKARKAPSKLKLKKP